MYYDIAYSWRRQWQWVVSKILIGNSIIHRKGRVDIGTIAHAANLLWWFGLSSTFIHSWFFGGFPNNSKYISANSLWNTTHFLQKNTVPCKSRSVLCEFTMWYMFHYDVCGIVLHLAVLYRDRIVLTHQFRVNIRCNSRKTKHNIEGLLPA